jgi:hypothetical protein
VSFQRAGAHLNSGEFSYGCAVLRRIERSRFEKMFQQRFLATCSFHFGTEGSIFSRSREKTIALAKAYVLGRRVSESLKLSWAVSLF